MTDLLANLVVGLFWAASWLAPLCDIDCQWEHDALFPAEMATDAIPGQCHGSPAATEHGTDLPSKDRPCKSGVHHRIAVFALSKPGTAVFALAAIVGGQEIVAAIALPGPAEQSLSPKFISLAVSKSGPLPLRI